MGANISTNASTTIQETQNTMKSSCTPTAAAQQTISGNYVVLRGDATCGNISFKNTARLNSTCDMQALASTLAQQAENLTEEQQAGLGLNMTTDLSTNTNIISNYLEQQCGPTSNLVQEMSNNRIEIWDDAQCEAIEFMNDADLTSSCVMKQVNDVVSKLEETKTTTQSGFTAGLDNPMTTMFSSASSSSLSFCILVILLIGGFMYLKSMGIM